MKSRRMTIVNRIHRTEMALYMRIRNEPRRKVYVRRRSPPESNQDYHQLFRFTEENVKFLTREFIRETEETRGGALSPKQQMEVTLRCLSDPGFQRSVGFEMGVSQSTVSKTLQSVVQQISEQAKDWIKFPCTGAEAQEANNRWYAKHEFPGCVGAIDCTHVRIEKPGGKFGDEFINRKNFPSFNVQATCDQDYIFTSIDCGWPGSVHDSRVFKNSDIYQTMSSSSYPCLLLGDEGYGITPFLMTPFSNPTNEEQKKFNKFHARGRVVIEQAFGQLKRRFPILRYGVRLKMDRISRCILACVVLHNVAKKLQDPEEFENDEWANEEDTDISEIPRDSDGTLRDQGRRRRDQIMIALRNH